MLLQINVTSELFSRGWLDGFIFVDRISVSATNSTDHVMLFSFEYSDDMGITYREYENKGIHVGIAFLPGFMQNKDTVIRDDVNVPET